jgi:hypothetical protein
MTAFEGRQSVFMDSTENVAYIPARQKSESSASEMDAPSFPQLSSKKRQQL